MLFFLFLICLLTHLNSWIVKTNLPKSLWGKKILVNGPREDKKYFSPFDGIGHITSLVFKENETIISEVVIPDEKNEILFHLVIFKKRLFKNN